MGNTVHHLDHHVLLKLVVVISTAVVIVYLSAIGTIDFFRTDSGSSATTSLTPTQAGEALVDDGSYDEAIELYSDQIASLETGLVEANLGLAQAYQANLELADAEAIYRKVLGLETSVKAGYIGLAQVLLDQNRTAEAAKVIADGLTVYPQDTTLLKLQDAATAEPGA